MSHPCPHWEQGMSFWISSCAFSAPSSLGCHGRIQASETHNNLLLPISLMRLERNLLTPPKNTVTRWRRENWCAMPHWHIDSFPQKVDKNGLFFRTTILAPSLSSQSFQSNVWRRCKYVFNKFARGQTLIKFLTVQILTWCEFTLQQHVEQYEPSSRWSFHIRKSFPLLLFFCL